MKQVRIAELKSRLSEHLRAVRAGETLTVLDRDTPVARITPVESTGSPLAVRPRPSRRARLAEVPLPPPLKVATDIVNLLIQERGER